ncbi:helix-turn-helix domain-containing protein [Billgrantia bachuensis]|uniref:Helix-turn-helix transcriptional regulator n=1 Tax=Billgrantia bachuensis TaxID=2717286 RepID=A0ABX0PT07_9GAMM|nr:helix-turn-helix transcriptional regulator [Halomonas bachuensis]NIC05232.1 helix-turn-helix transcriptional regulator [Halomonas bachuensis]
MSDESFQVTNREWAKREFPKRLLRLAIEEHGYSEGEHYGVNKDIADRLGVSRSAVTRWLNGSVPGIENLLAIAKAYKTTPDYLVGNDNAPPGKFDFGILESNIPRPLLLHVLTVMSELRASAKNLTDEWFAEATVRLLERVSENPDMSRHEIMGLAYELLRNGPDQAGSASADTPER